MGFAKPVPNPMKNPFWHSNPSVWQEYLIGNFAGGLNSYDPASSIGQNQFQTLTNYYVQDNGTLKTRGAYRPYLVTQRETVLPDSAPPLTFKWVTLGDTDYLFASWDNGSNYEVSYWDDTNQRWAGDGGGTSIKTDLTDSYTVEFCKYSINNAEDLIFCNGKDVPQRWTGSGASSNLGLSAPGNPTSLSSSETATADKDGIAYNGNYYYKFTAFYDSSGSDTKYGESGGTNASAAMAVGSVDISDDTTSELALTSCPAVPSGATKVNIYRSPPDESNGPYRYVGYYASGTSFDDSVSTAKLGDEIPLDDGEPPRIKHPVVFNGILWGVGLSNGGALTNKLVYSNSGQPDMFAATSAKYLPEDIKGIIPFRESLYVFTLKSTYIIKDANPANDPLKICDIGCSSHRSLADVGNGLVWLYDNNIYWADFNTYNEKEGDFPFPIGQPVKNHIDNIPSLRRVNTVGRFHDGKYYVSFTGLNQTVNTTTLVWNVEVGLTTLKQRQYGGWSRLNWAANDIQSFKGALYSADNTNKYVMEHDYAGAVDYHTKTEYTAGTSHNIATEIKTGLLFFGHEQAKKLISSVSTVTETSGITYAITFDLDEGDYQRSKNIILGSGTFAADNNYLVWGQGTWGNFNWGANNYGLQKSHVKIPRGTKCENASVTYTSSNSQDTNVTLIKVYYKILSPPA